MKIFFTLNLILLINLCLLGQSGIKGNIKSDNGTPLEFANVLVYNSVDSAFVKGFVTNIEGVYDIDIEVEGQYYLHASLLGYQTVILNDINVTGDKKITLDEIRLNTGIELEEVTIRSRRPLIELKADKIIMNIDGSSVAVGNNALEVLQKSPGVIVDQNNTISLKGKQGVLILIDGKNQYISNEQLSTILQAMPSNAIDKIEIVHNPSSKYDAAGNAGVINIKLKKKENIGLNGNISLGGGIGRYPKANGGLSLNYRTEKINIYGNYNTKYWKGYQELTLNRSIPIQEDFSLFNQESEMLNNSTSNNVKLGVDYYLSNKTTIGILGRTNIGNWNNDNENSTNITGINVQGFDNSVTISNAREDWNQLAGNVNIKHEFSENSDLNFDIDYSQYDNPSVAAYENYFYESNGSTSMPSIFLNNENDIKVDILATKIDFTNQFDSGLSIDIGAKYSTVTTDNQTTFMEFQHEEWVSNPDISNQFQYDETILAGYVNASKTIDKLTIQGGLRIEHTKSDGNSITLDQRVNKEYTNFFPSISLSYPLTEKQNLSLSYSRRIDRPSYRKLNPFMYFLDQFTFEKGNPFLNPQFTNSFGINYSIGNSLFVSANYSHTTDAITQVIDQIDATQETFQTEINLDDYKNYSLNITTPIIINEAWTNRWSITSFYNDFSSQLESGSLSNQQLSYNINMSNEVSITQKLKAEVIGSYQSNLAYGVFELKPQYSIDLGLSYKLMNGLANIKISVKDVFKTNKSQVNVNQNTIDLQAINRWESRRAHISFDYNFGNQKVKKARRRTTATSDEENRISTGNN